jgi:hypothetical protein
VGRFIADTNTRTDSNMMNKFYTEWENAQKAYDTYSRTRKWGSSNARIYNLLKRAYNGYGEQAGIRDISEQINKIKDNTNISLERRQQEVLRLQQEQERLVKEVLQKLNMWGD